MIASSIIAILGRNRLGKLEKWMIVRAALSRNDFTFWNDDRRKFDRDATQSYKNVSDVCNVISNNFILLFAMQIKACIWDAANIRCSWNLINFIYIDWRNDDIWEFFLQSFQVFDKRNAGSTPFSAELDDNDLSSGVSDQFIDFLVWVQMLHVVKDILMNYLISQS